VLLDVAPDAAMEQAIRQRLEIGSDRITDLHLWQIGPGHRAAVVSIVSDQPLPPAAYKQRLRDVPRLSHITIEVQPCRA
jgi:Co/Zn/Cd efflux system component